MANPIKSSQRPGWWRRNWFYVTLITLAIVGVLCAFFLPPLIPGVQSAGETTDSLRKAILAVLAGSLTMLTLSETHRKNNQEKEKNERDHIRQVYAERRSRYTTAVEQLANEKAAVRLGGIYTLVSLIDEWLADDTLEPEERQKEGQVIINNLCSYVRSPFPPVERLEEYEAPQEFKELEAGDSKNFSTEKAHYQKSEDLSSDQTAFREEQDVRRTIFSEMSNRSSTFTEDGAVVPNVWSNFDFDFSRAPIFYPLENLTIEKANFSSSRFYRDTTFFRSVFIQKANFRGATFAQNADFTLSAFTQNAIFSWATFTQKAIFTTSVFAQNADFWGATFAQNTDFSWVIFTQNADFSSATFTQNADFSEAMFEESSPKFVAVSEDLDKTFRAQFSVLSVQGEYEFAVRKGSKPIELGAATLLGKPFEIPVGTVLFDPSSGETSEPAKPLDKSNDGEEDKSK